MTRCRCDSCGGTALHTPVEVFNPPGQSEISYRVGAHGQFLSSMRARLSSPAYPALRGLTVRSTDDPAIALLDACAVLADLLTFYSERIANEGYLRTATEEQSLVLLGRLVGYGPRPGVSAGTYLAYTIEADARGGSDLELRIPRGARAQSVPGPGEEPQAFETVEELLARRSWNDLKVRLRRPYQLRPTDLTERATIQVAGVATNLKPGDRLLFVFGAGEGRQHLVVVPGVRLDRDNDVTEIGLPQPALPALDDLRKALTSLLRPLVEPEPGEPDEPPEIVRRSAILQRFVEQVLTPLWTRRDTLDTPTRFAAALADTLERLAETRQIAQHYRHIRDWLGQLADQLTELVTLAGQLEPAQPPDETTQHHVTLADQVVSQPLFTALGLDSAADGNPANPPNPVATSPAVLGLGALLGALRTPPSRPPASARHLARDPRAIFAPGSDLGAQLLAALDPRLHDGLYTAWRSVDLTAPLALQDLLAMRVVATPYGATAPLRPVSGGGQEEWPLRASLVLRLRVNYAADAPDSAELAFSADAETWRDTLNSLTEPTTIDFGPGQVELAVDEDTGEVSFHFEKELPEHGVTVAPEKPDGTVAFTITNGGTIEGALGLGQQHFEYRAGTWITVRRVAAANDAPEHLEFEFLSYALTPRNVLALDAVYDGIGPGTWVVIERPRKGEAVPGDEAMALVTARVTKSRTIAKQAFGMSGKVTELVLDRPWMDARDELLSQIRDATVYARGDALRLADEPIVDEVADSTIELAELYDGLTPGRWAIVTGERTDIPGRPEGIRGTELVMIAGVSQGVDPTRPGEGVHTTITLAAPLAYRYRRETVHVYANVVRANHGASRDEPIGSGDAGTPNQSFLLRQGPLTWLAADTPLGAASTLEIRVDGVRWTEVDSLAGRGPDEHVYVTAPGENNTTAVTFGDGVHGARLPTGVENVRASYRVGLGKAGNVGAGQITQLTTRPLGVSAVTNPVPATGGANRDDAGQLRRNIPLRVTALDRLVSVPDYADFARARAGIGRASARRLFAGDREIVHVTVAGVDDIALQDDSDIVTTLHSALVQHGDAQLPVRVAVREAVLLVIAANIRVHPDHSWDIVEPAVRAALLDRLGFAQRELGQPAYLSEVLATAQAVPGVDAVDVDVFAGVPGNITPVDLEHLAESLASPRSVVPARLAEFAQTRYTVDPPTGQDQETLTAIAAKHGISVAELLRLNPDIVDATPLPRGRSVVVFRGVRPAQLVVLSPAVPDTLILKEARPS